MRNLFGNKKSVLNVCIFLVLIACFSFCCHVNEKEELNGTKAERRKFEEYDESNIMYPYIILDNSDLQNQINRQISDAIIGYCESPSICSFEVDYEIKCFNEEYLSILFEGMRIPFGGPHPSDIAWGITFDMKSGKMLGITDIIEEKELQDQLSKKLFVTKRGMDIDIYESLAGEADWCEKYTGYSMHYYDKEHKNDFYLSGEAIGIMFGVSHAVGDYVIVEIKTSEESDHCKIVDVELEAGKSSPKYVRKKDCNVEETNMNDETNFYGIWHIDKVVLQSKMYTGSVTDGDFEENLYDPEDYISMEVEYDSEYFRLGSERYNSPKYIFTNRTVKDINDGGKFCNPEIYEFILDEKIEVVNADHYNSLTEVPLLQIEVRFSKEVSYGDYDFIPVGTQCIILNEDTMLIGIWGKILLAHRIL